MMESTITARGRPVVLVAAHKPYTFPHDDAYLPVQAGATLHSPIGIQRDDEGEGISDRNHDYCELTVLYWGWKNLRTDRMGLMHYRRYLGHGKRIASGEELARLLDEAPVVLPKKRHYWIETGESQYVHAHGQESLDALRRVMGRHQPEYLPIFEKTLRRTSGHRFNMFVMRRDVLDAYCEWLFGLLFALEEEEPQTQFSRIYGFLSERMLDCWLIKNGVAYRELPVVYTEPQDWPKKILRFLKWKFCLKEGEVG